MKKEVLSISKNKKHTLRRKEFKLNTSDEKSGFGVSKMRNTALKSKRGLTFDEKRDCQHFKEKKRTLRRKGFKLNVSDEKKWLQCFKNEKHNPKKGKGLNLRWKKRFLSIRNAPLKEKSSNEEPPTK
jgi:hypothetical protein